MARDPGPLALTTTDGITLEAEWAPATPTPVGEVGEVGDGRAGAVTSGPPAVVVLAHPHPAHGGNMRSLVTSELFRTLPERGIPTLRFNFRGVGSSGGHHEGGVAERADVAAAVAAAAAEEPDLPLVLSGWSFGADVSLAVVDPAVDGWFAVAPPLRILPSDAYLAAADPRPKVLAVPEHDEFNPPARCGPKVAAWRATTVEVIAGADHFLVGRTAALADLLVAFAADLGARGTPT
jgi:alpha/beta superfamily hydrolase